MVKIIWVLFKAFLVIIILVCVNFLRLRKIEVEYLHQIQIAESDWGVRNFEGCFSSNAWKCLACDRDVEHLYKMGKETNSEFGQSLIDSYLNSGNSFDFNNYSYIISCEHEILLIMHYGKIKSNESSLCHTISTKARPNRMYLYKIKHMVIHAPGTPL